MLPARTRPNGSSGRTTFGSGRKDLEILRQAQNDKLYEITVKNKISKGDKVEILTPAKLYQDEIVTITDLDGHELPEINPGRTDQKAVIKLTNKYPNLSFIRKLVDSHAEKNAEGQE